MSNANEDPPNQGLPPEPSIIKVAAHVKYKPDPTITINPVTGLVNNSYVQDREHTGIVGILLSIRHCSQSTNARAMTTATSRYNPGLNNSRMRIANRANVPYDRLLTFGDIKDPSGRCFVVSLKNVIQSQKFFRHAIRGMEGVGNVFLIKEPNAITNYLGTTKSLLLVEGFNNCVPLDIRYANFLPSIPISVPRAGNTQYFCQHGCKDIVFQAASMEVSYCNGLLCDRQEGMLTVGQRCGCLYESGTSEAKLVVCMDLLIRVPEDFEVSGFATIEQFKSRRTSGVFVPFSDWSVLDSYDPEDIEENLRNNIRRVTEHVNNHGGWTCIGWLRTGMVNDVSDTTVAENLASMTQHPHVSYLYPTDPDCISEDREDFRQCRKSLVPRQAVGAIDERN